MSRVEIVSFDSLMNSDWTQQALQHAVSFDPTFRIVDGKLDWDSKEFDQEILKKVDKLLSKDWSDEELKENVIVIEWSLFQSLLFRKLFHPIIKVSEEHERVNPFFHTINVLLEGVSNELVSDFRKIYFWSKIYHDLAKMFGASGPESRFHPALSALLAMVLDTVLNVSESRKEQMLLAIYYHHTFEEIDRWEKNNAEYQRQIRDGDTTDILEYAKTHPEIKNLISRFDDEDLAKLIFLLSTADVASIPKYKEKGIIEQIVEKFILIRPDLKKWVESLEKDKNTQPMIRPTFSQPKTHPQQSQPQPGALGE